MRDASKFEKAACREPEAADCGQLPAARIDRHIRASDDDQWIVDACLGGQSSQIGADAGRATGIGLEQSDEFVALI
jgi:hypothetical protein